MSKLKNMKVLTTAAMLAAAGIILGFFKLPISNILEIRFSSLPIMIAGWLFGPVVGGIVGGLVDIGGYIIRPTGPFVPAFTLDTILTGVIFGLILYRKNLSIKRLIVASVINAVIVNMILNTFWLSLLYKMPFMATFIARLPKECITVPLYTFVLYVIMKPVSQIKFVKTTL